MLIMSSIVFGRMLMASSLAVHIIFAVTGIALPLLVSAAEFLGIVRRDEHYTLMARRWTRTMLVLFAVGSVTGTIVGFQITLLWPGFMALAGKVIALPFAIEIFPFFVEAIFLAIYVYGWNRIRNPWLHWLTSLPIVVAAAASGLLITIVNAFMNSPTGFTLKNGQLVDVDPVAAIFNPSMLDEISHVLVTAYLCTGIALAGMAAFALLRKRGPAAYHERVLRLGMAVSAVAAMLAIVTGDRSAKSVALYQPEKLAAMEALFESQYNAPLTVGGVIDTAHQRVIGGIELPGFLSWLAFGRTDAHVTGLDAVARSQWPPLLIHYTFDAMVGIGMWLGALTLCFWALYFLRRRWLSRRLVLWAIALSLPLGYVAMELGWMTTEIGRQPWIIYHVMTVAQAFTTAPNVPQLFFLFLTLYAALSVGTVVVLRHYFRAHALPEVISSGHVGDVGEMTDDGGLTEPATPPTSPLPAPAARRARRTTSRRHARRSGSRASRKVEAHG
jgi:cytochrome bd ubiquinol oxidase subunit I